MIGKETVKLKRKSFFTSSQGGKYRTQDGWRSALTSVSCGSSPRFPSYFSHLPKALLLSLKKEFRLGLQSEYQGFSWSSKALQVVIPFVKGDPDKAQLKENTNDLSFLFPCNTHCLIQSKWNPQSWCWKVVFHKRKINQPTYKSIYSGYLPTWYGDEIMAQEL